MPSLNVSNVKGVRQALADLLHMTKAAKTPLMSAAAKTTDKFSLTYEWPTDSFDEPQFDGVLDNEDASDFENANDNYEILEGRIQKFWRKPMVSDFVEEVTDIAGIGEKKAMARSVNKKLQELKFDIESALCGDQDSRKQAGKLGNRLRGLGSWINSSAQTDLPVPSTQRTPAASIFTGSLAAMTEDDVQDLVESIYNEKDESIDYMLLCGSKLKRKFTSFTMTQKGNTNMAAAIRTFVMQAEAKKIVSSIDVWEGDCGTLTITLSQYLARDNADRTVGRRRGYVLDPADVQIGYKRMPRFKPLQDGGGGPRGIVDAILGDKVLSPLGMGKFDPSA